MFLTRNMIELLFRATDRRDASSGRTVRPSDVRGTRAWGKGVCGVRRRGSVDLRELSRR